MELIEDKKERETKKEEKRKIGVYVVETKQQ